MNTQELKKIGDVLCTADGGCGSCVKDIFLEFCKAFPEHTEEMMQIYSEGDFNAYWSVDELREEIENDIRYEAELNREDIGTTPQ